MAKVRQVKKAPAEEVDTSSVLQRAFEKAGLGVAHIGSDRRFMRVNRRLCEMLGYPEHELLRLTGKDISHPDDLDTDLGYLRQLAAGEISTYQMEKRYYHKHGHVVWVLLTVALVRGDNGEPLYFVSQIQDVSDRKRVERRIQAFSALALELNLVETPDVMATLGAEKRPGQWLVGFALETDDQRFRALAKLERKSCDLMVLNGPSAMDAADNQVEVLDKTGAVVLSLAGSKTAVAKGILRVIQDRLIKR